ncbi:hypothetical protein AciX9_0271 [Granulicella tundricola MP5ACTX9]|uniref:Zinc finger CGNR domain-containing protein n=2 Tax=Granulicella TaxID=940557 RepID=E8WW38_GRATM|nr:hypothetical protein AciX9_0271 [Granulicella tundricola MP5ACTX9]
MALIRWLNGANDAGIEAYLGRPTAASRKRVMTLFRQLIECSGRLSRFDTDHPNFDFFDSPPPEITEEMARIQLSIQEFVQVPFLEIAYEDDKAILAISYALGANRALGEQLAVRDIVGLLETRRLELMRQCECHLWFFARKSDQRACSQNCRHRAYEQTDAFKAKRRLYMRDYYALKQSGKVK